MFNWHKKEKPFQGIAGMGGGVVSRLLGGAGQIGATGGDVTYDVGTNRIHVFTQPGTLSNDSSAQIVAEYIIIGGGGGGGPSGGGGGAGGVISSIPGVMPATRTSLTMEAGTNVSVTIGAGGPGGSAGQPDSYTGGQQGGNGYDSYFAGPAGNSDKALGGGSGGAEGNTGPPLLQVSVSAGGQGGSGGGGRAGRNEATPTGGLDSQGSSGSEAAGSPQYPPGIAGGGGGGAKQSGTYGSVNVDGGFGLQLPPVFRDPTQPPAVLGDPGTYGGGSAPTPGGFWFAGGGGGYTDSNYPIPSPRGGPYGDGGAGGGGRGREFRDPDRGAMNGKVNTGGGGGGDAASGGSGIAFFYYPI